MASGLRAWLEHRIVTLLMGSSLVATGLFELSETLVEDMIGFEIRAEYGIILFGLTHGLKGLVEVIEGSRHIKRTHGSKT